MLRKFRVYPKVGEPFTVLLNHFTLNDDSFSVFDEDVTESKNAFLSFRDIAAVLPEEQREDEKKVEGAIRFHCYLRGRQEPLEVFAHSFKTDQPPSLVFYWLWPHPEQALTDIYVALSEVVAVVPAEGLRRLR